MKKLLLLLIAGLMSFTTSFAQSGRPAQDRRVRIIVDNDFCGDPDGLFALAHQVLCESVNIRGIIGAHLNSGRQMPQQGDQAATSVQKAGELMEAMGLSGKFRIVPGAPKAMERTDEPVDSQGARLIIEEARQCTPQNPLFVLMGGPLTDISSALLLEPGIAQNIIVLWIGGQEYPFGHQKPRNGISEVEYNLNLSIPAARYLFNESDVRLWQIPRDAYRTCLYSFASHELNVKGAGTFGEYLDKSLATWRRFNTGAVYVMGDSPLVLLSSLQTFFEPDTASSDFVETAAPFVTEDGRYDFSKGGRTIRVYTRLDNALMFKDMEDRFALHAAVVQSR